MVSRAKKVTESSKAGQAKVSSGDSLPESVIGPAHIMRLIREVESLEESITQLKLVKNAATATDLPHVSKMLGAVAESKGLSLKKYADRQALTGFLHKLQQSPTVNITFATQPTEQTLRSLTQWFRTHGDSHTLLAVNLQPSLLAGCLVRTQNKLFDFSAQQKIVEKRSGLVAQIKETL